MTDVVAPPRKSTIVRMFIAPWPVRTAFTVLDRIAPAAGAVWAERIWFTLPQRRPDRVAGPGGGERFSVTVDGRAIVGTSWGTGPVVYLVHGWAGNSGQLTPFVASLVASGYRAVVFDMPSHGDSEPGAHGPTSSTIPEFAKALLGVADRFGPPHSIIAHSMGATATAVAIAGGLAANRLVLLAPMASPRSYARQFAAIMGFGPRTYAHLIRRIERRVGLPVEHFDVPELGRDGGMPPTLVVHDRDDNSTPATDGADIAAAWPNARLRSTTGLGHRRLLRDGAVIAEVIEFVRA